MKLSFELCDFGNPDHLKSLVALLGEYMEDPMGEHPPLNKFEQLRMVDGLSNHPTAFVLFACCEGRAVGMATCFELFSTFKVKPFVNIHDLVVTREWRGIGIGRAILRQVEIIARERGCCKVSLEVRRDNTVAQGLYRIEGFAEAEPDMLFWVKPLSL